MCCVRFRLTRDHKRTLDAQDYGYKCWPINCGRPGCVNWKTAKDTQKMSA